MVDKLEAAMKMSNNEIERLNAAMKQTSDKRLVIRLRLEGHTFKDKGKET